MKDQKKKWAICISKSSKLFYKAQGSGLTSPPFPIDIPSFVVAFLICERNSIEASVYSEVAREYEGIALMP